MTPSQIDRAVRAALMDAVPPLVARLRAELLLHLGASLSSPRTPVAPAGEAWDRHWAGVVAPVIAAAPPAPSVEPAPAAAGEPRPKVRTRKLLTQEQLAELRAAFNRGDMPPAVADRMGIPRTTVFTRFAAFRAETRVPAAVPAPAAGAPLPAAPAASAAPVDDAAFRDAWANAGLTVAEVGRQFGLNEDAARARAKRLGLGAKVAARRHEPKAPLEAVPAAGLEPVPASPDDAADWLTGALQRERLSPGEIEQRLAILRPAGVLAECNARRVKLGLPPYVIARRAA